MTEKVRILRRENLPMPLICLASAEDLAAWYAGGLLWSLDHGERALSISCFDCEGGMGIDLGRGAQAVLRAVTDVLYDHPEAESLTILCGDDASYRAYSFYWNLWYAETKPRHGGHGGEAPLS